MFAALTTMSPLGSCSCNSTPAAAVAAPGTGGGSLLAWHASHLHRRRRRRRRLFDNGLAEPRVRSLKGTQPEVIRAI